MSQINFLEPTGWYKPYIISHKTYIMRDKIYIMRDKTYIMRDKTYVMRDKTYVMSHNKTNNLRDSCHDQGPCKRGTLVGNLHGSTRRQ